MAATGIELTARHNPFAWMLSFTKLTVAVDGAAQIYPWGTTFIPVQPGNHQVEVSFRYFGSPRGPASAAVTVPDGGVARLTYRMASWMFAAGKLEVS